MRCGLTRKSYLINCSSLILQPFSLLLTLWSVLSTRRWQFVALGVSENCNARLIPTIISAVDGVKSLRRWLSWWMARLRQIRSPLTSSRHLPLSSWVCKLAYYRKNIMQPDDNPPIGILLCSAVEREMAEYSLLDLDESVFISKYQLNVPSKERMTEFLRKENEGLYNKV